MVSWLNPIISLFVHHCWRQSHLSVPECFHSWLNRLTQTWKHVSVRTENVGWSSGEGILPYIWYNCMELICFLFPVYLLFQWTMPERSAAMFSHMSRPMLQFFKEAFRMSLSHIFWGHLRLVYLKQARHRTFCLGDTHLPYTQQTWPVHNLDSQWNIILSKLLEISNVNGVEPTPNANTYYEYLGVGRNVYNFEVLWRHFSL